MSSQTRLASVLAETTSLSAGLIISGLFVLFFVAFGVGIWRSVRVHLPNPAEMEGERNPEYRLPTAGAHTVVTRPGPQTGAQGPPTNFEDLTPSPSCLVYLFAHLHVAPVERWRLPGGLHRLPSGYRVMVLDLQTWLMVYAMWSLRQQGLISVSLCPSLPSEKKSVYGSLVYRRLIELVQRQPLLDARPLVSPATTGRMSGDWFALFGDLTTRQIGRGELERLLLAELLALGDKQPEIGFTGRVGYIDTVGYLAYQRADSSMQYCRSEARRLGLIRRSGGRLVEDPPAPALAQQHQAVVREMEEFRQSEPHVYEALLHRCRIGAQLPSD